jgi:hypothetical protein
MEDVSQHWLGQLEPGNNLQEQELLKSGGADLIASRGEFGQKIFGLQMPSLLIPFDSIAPLCNGERG